MNGMPSFDDARLFVEVAARLSFVEAARRLAIPTSTLSRRVVALEEELGQRLLQRTSRQVALTAEGARLFEQLAPHVAGVQQALGSAADRAQELSGQLRVTAPLVTGAERIAPALASFLARHPKLTLELRLTNAMVDLVEEGFDLAFRLGPIAERELVARRLWTYPFALAASPAFVQRALHGRTILTPREVPELPGIAVRAGRGWMTRDRRGRTEELFPLERVVVSDPRVALATAAQGLGIALAPEAWIDQHGKALLKLTLRGRSLLARELFAVYPSRTLLPARARQALDWVIANG